MNRVTHPDKEVKRLHYEFRAPLFVALPAGLLWKFTSLIKAAAFTKAAFIKQPAGGGQVQGYLTSLAYT